MPDRVVGRGPHGHARTNRQACRPGLQHVTLMPETTRTPKRPLEADGPPFDLAGTPGHYRAISHGKQESSTATEEPRSLQLSGRDGCAPYTFQAGHAGSIPVARCQLVSAVLASCESTSSPAADRSLRKRFISWKPNAA